jgi:tetratricopeptide (TPR) repeat protein
MEKSSEGKKRFLQEALHHRVETIKIIEQRERSSYWNQGVMRNYLAEIESELADLADDKEYKKKTLNEAAVDKEAALRLCSKGMLLYEKAGSVSLFASLGQFQYEHGNLLSRLHGITGDVEHLRKAAEALEESAISFQKLDQMSRIAECYWKVAQTYDTLGEHSKAAERFNAAAQSYKCAAERIPQLNRLYKEHASYMQAWSEIEKAKFHHARQEHGVAKEHFEKAANLHEMLEQWSYLAPNYYAWVKVEQAEELSREEKSEKAISAFEEAAKLFMETRESLQTQLGKIEDPDEKQMATNIAGATDLRHEYCIARITLEEAKILDKEGDHYSSADKYGMAAENFDKICQRLASEQEQKECKFIISLSRAWQKMMQAEAEASPALYMDASELFEEAKAYGSNEKTRMLALGHSHVCRALEAGARFVDTRDMKFHATAVQHLESAADYYMKAGLENYSEYAKATGLLFDAYVYMDNAKKESDPEKKARLYILTEKVLQASSNYYTKAEHVGRSEQVMRLFQRVKEERELAVSLAEVFRAPIIVSTTSFFSPTPTFERAVGLEPFEHADVKANIAIRQKKVKLGDSFDLRIELANAGKGSALLTKIVEAIPAGFELLEQPEPYTVEDSCLNLKGKRLDPLNTMEIRLVVRPKTQGVFTLKPKILYLDENSEHRSHEPSSTNITVIKDLGIRGWIKGETSD